MEIGTFVPRLMQVCSCSGPVVVRASIDRPHALPTGRDTAGPVGSLGQAPPPGTKGDPLLVVGILFQ